MALRPWYKIVTPREDLRDGGQIDASEFAVHLDKVRDGRAPSDYQDPQRFFERTYMTKNLTEFSANVIKRLSGEKTGTAVYNLTTQFGGGKTHALTLLYHLAKSGPIAGNWTGVPQILSQAGVPRIPKASVAVFVGTEFDTITGRGGDNGTPLRKTPWGEIAYQLGGEESFNIVKKQDENMTAPGGDVIRKIFPKDRPCLILMDEVLNYMSRYRKMGMQDQFYNFIHSLSGVVSGEKNIVLVISLPASELEMTVADQADFDRIRKLFNRESTPLLMSEESETSEIIRRRLFEWKEFPKEAEAVINQYSEWVLEHKQQLPSSFNFDKLQDTFKSTYPFHPMVLSVFKHKWQELPRFQQTRGLLKLLAIWVSKSYADGYSGKNKDLLIELGSAPLDDSRFRAEIYQQLGETRLEGVITTDIASNDSHSIQLDKTANDTIKNMRLHQKVATIIFFESNGGQAKNVATVPEIRMAVSAPGIDIGNVETVLETLSTSCYYLVLDGKNYRFSLRENLNKRFVDKKANIPKEKINEIIRAEVQNVFKSEIKVERKLFPEKSNDIPNRPALTLVVLAPNHSMQEKNTVVCLDSMTKNYGTTARTFKSALIWAIADDEAPLREEARNVLAWEDINDEQSELNLDDSQKKQLSENYNRSKRDLKECIWRAYKYIGLLDKTNTIRFVNLGLVHSSSASSIVELIIGRLRQDGEITDQVSPNYLVRNWPGAFVEWSTKDVRDAFFASPLFPRLMDPDSIKRTIAKGVAEKRLAYVGKSSTGAYDPFLYGEDIQPDSIEIFEDMYIITGDVAEKHIKPKVLTSITISDGLFQAEPGKPIQFKAIGKDQNGDLIEINDVNWEALGGTIDSYGKLIAGNHEGEYTVKASIGPICGTAKYCIRALTGGKPIDGKDSKPPLPEVTTEISWTGEIPMQKWMTFYSKIVSKYTNDSKVKLTVTMEVQNDNGVSSQKIDETKASLKEQGLDDKIKEVKTNKF